jgi:hypothetical protein
MLLRYGGAMVDKTKAPSVYKYTLLEPLKYAKASRSVSQEEWFKFLVQFKLWNLTEVEIPTETAIKETGTAITRLEKVLSKHYKKKKLNSGIMQNMVGPMYFDQLNNELVMSKSMLAKWSKARKAKRQNPTRYTTGTVSTVKSMCKFWNKAVGSRKRINAYSEGDSYELKEGEKPSKNPRLQEIDVRYNPGGAFIQRTLDICFDISLNNAELQRLLNKVYDL